MVRIYRGRRTDSGATVVTVDGTRVLLPDAGALAVRFDWGQASAGSTALARALLLDHLDALPARSVLHRFAFTTVQTWTEDRWTCTMFELDAALRHVQQQLRLTCPLCADTGRREVTARLWRACACRPLQPEA